MEIATHAGPNNASCDKDRDDTVVMDIAQCDSLSCDVVAVCYNETDMMNAAPILLERVAGGHGIDPKDLPDPIRDS